MRARIQRISAPVENADGITPIGKVANLCRMDMDYKEKDRGYSFVSEQVEFLCVR